MRWCAEKDEPLQLVLMCSTAAGLDQAKKLANNLLDTIRTDWDAHRCELDPYGSGELGCLSLKNFQDLSQTVVVLDPILF